MRIAGTILFWLGERLVMLAVSALPFVACFLLDGSVGAPLASYSAAEYRSIIAMNGFSVASLFALIGFAFPSVTEPDSSSTLVDVRGAPHSKPGS